MDLEIIDDLNSTDGFAALSANQGRILRLMIENVATDDDIDALFA